MTFVVRHDALHYHTSPLWRRIVDNSRRHSGIAKNNHELLSMTHGRAGCLRLSKATGPKT
jgi:hypothetical protein